MSDIGQLQLVFLLLLLFIAIFGALAQKLKLPYPILLVIGGLLISLIPNLPHVSLAPNYVFLVILPPLLYSAAFETSWSDFRQNIASISMLAFGLVGFTTIGVGVAAHFLLPGFDWRLGMTLGAIVSPTDAIAATAIAKRLSLPRRIVDILEGESLVNDASGLVAMKFAIALVVSGTAPSLWQSGAELIYLVGGGIVAGLAVGRVVYWVEQRVDNAPSEITLSLITPYLAYIAAEQLQASGILAVVVCGLYLGRRSSRYLSSAVRLENASIWNGLTFILNGLVFLLIGLQIRPILQHLRGISYSDLATTASVTIVAIILLRLAWVFPAATLAYHVRRKLKHHTFLTESPKGIFVIGWTGMRGVISLAAAFSLPQTVDNGTAFPQREVIIFITFSVIFATLVLQGLTLPMLIRALGLGGDDSLFKEEKNGRQQMLKAALQELEKIRDSDQSGDKPDKAAFYNQIGDTYRRRLQYLNSLEHDREPKEDAGDLLRYRMVTSDLRAVERNTILKLRDQHEISDIVLRKLERELDLLEVRFPRKH